MLRGTGTLYRVSAGGKYFGTIGKIYLGFPTTRTSFPVENGSPFVTKSRGVCCHLFRTSYFGIYYTVNISWDGVKKCLISHAEIKLY